MVDALFVDPKGIYPQLLGPMHCWDEERDARTYAGPGPVVAHPPCQLWTNLCAANFKRYRKTRPAWYFGGGDSGLFHLALNQVLKCGGVLEHPAYSHAFKHFGLGAPKNYKGGWEQRVGWGEVYWVCEVWQSAYGHRAQKKTWLVYCGDRPPFELNWARERGTHQVGWQDKRGKARNLPTLSKAEANATPEAFARELIRLAEWSRGTVGSGWLPVGA